MTHSTAMVMKFYFVLDNALIRKYPEIESLNTLLSVEKDAVVKPLVLLDRQREKIRLLTTAKEQLDEIFNASDLPGLFNKDHKSHTSHPDEADKQFDSLARLIFLDIIGCLSNYNLLTTNSSLHGVEKITLTVCDGYSNEVREKLQRLDPGELTYVEKYGSVGEMSIEDAMLIPNKHRHPRMNITVYLKRPKNDISCYTND